MNSIARSIGNRGACLAVVSAAVFVEFFSAGAVCFSQDTAARGDGSFEACAADMDKAPGDAYDSCGRFVEHSPTGDSENVRKAKDWLGVNAPKRPFVRFLKSLSSDNQARFIVYQPDMTIELPPADRETSSGKLKISRSFGNLTEEAMLRKAEAVYPAPAEMIHLLFTGWSGWPFGSSENMEPIWGVPGNDEIVLTSTVTARAVRYYYDIVLEAEKDPKMPSGFNAMGTSLDYEATIHYLDRYKHGEDSYESVYVANLDLTWGFSCGGLCGMGFTRNKVVILDRPGDVIALYLDAPVNSEFWVS
ncbi:MAG TPA: hypothetical protein VMP12_05375 [Candidatus Sulfotelmatobacter sp.]|nr:hypothetical protein [Candidatus Sulfotelmatobacter sp.]